MQEKRKRREEEKAREASSVEHGVEDKQVQSRGYELLEQLFYGKSLGVDFE